MHFHSVCAAGCEVLERAALRAGDALGCSSSPGCLSAAWEKGKLIRDVNLSVTQHRAHQGVNKPHLELVSCPWPWAGVSSLAGGQGLSFSLPQHSSWGSDVVGRVWLGTYPSFSSCWGLGTDGPWVLYFDTLTNAGLLFNVSVISKVACLLLLIISPIRKLHIW